MYKDYNNLIKLETFLERFEYLQLFGEVGRDIFGFERYLNQILYNSSEWKRCRRDIIIRDNGCDLGVAGRELKGRVLVHHIEPITIEDIEERNHKIFDPNNLITVSHNTHLAIHYGDEHLLTLDPVERTMNDTTPWKTE